MNQITQTGLIKSATELELVGRGLLTIRPNDHVATGGEGSIYKPSPKTVIKIYTDRNKMLHEGIDKKIEILSRIKHPFIVAPQGLVLHKGKPVGYYMNFEEGDHLARVFTTAYWQREKFGIHDAIHLVDGMRTAILEGHAHKAVLVDANEFNWLVSRTKRIPEPRVIDVDSWSIGSWKPSVIMPSIKDWHTQGFNENSDWFSFGVVSFQVFSGVHPYKGTLDGYKSNETERRMKENKSIFTKGIRLNSAVRDLNTIPGPLLDWYHEIFEQKTRSIPPSPRDVVQKTPAMAIRRQSTVLSGTNDLVVFDELFDGTQDKPIRIHPVGIIELQSGKLIQLDSKKHIFTKTKKVCEIIQTDEGLLIAELETSLEKVTFTCIDNRGVSHTLNTEMRGHQILRSNNRLFIVNNSALHEVSLKKLSQYIVLNKQKWGILEKGTQWFDGVGIQDTLGTHYLVLPFGENACTYVRLPEIKGHKIIDALAGPRYVHITTVDPRDGKYYSHDIVFSKDYDAYTHSKTEVALPEVNMTMLPKGVRVSVRDDGELMIFVPTNGQERIVKHNKIYLSNTLAHSKDTVLYIDGSKVWSIKLK